MPTPKQIETATNLISKMTPEQIESFKPGLRAKGHLVDTPEQFINAYATVHLGAQGCISVVMLILAIALITIAIFSMFA